MPRIRFCAVVGVALLSLLSLPGVLRSGEALSIEQAKVENDIAWYDIRLLGVEGQGFTDTAAPFDRLPARAEKIVRPPVWSLSRDSAGMAVRFVTEATELSARWKLTKANLAMPHMPATGVSGLDLYVKGDDGKWRWVVNGRPTAQENTAKLFGGIEPGRREFLLYLPLYNGVTSVEVGVPKAVSLAKADPRASQLKPIVFWGTSITHGACASRPGMVHTAILGRWLDAPVINLGFSGNGQMEAEVAQLIAEIDASCYVIDCLPNLEAGAVAQRTEPLVAILRKAHPTTPIVLVEDRSYADSHLILTKRTRNLKSREALKTAFDRLKAGDANLHYIPGEDLLGDDWEGTVDSSHPTDLGFMRQAEAFQKVLEPVLKKN